MAYRQGDYARATGLLKEGAAKLPEDATLMYYLGMAQFRNNERTDSKRSLQQALNLNLNDTLALSAKQILAELK